MDASLPELFDIDPAYALLGALVFGAVAALVLGLRFLLASRVNVVEERVRRFVTETRSSYPPPPAAVDAVAPVRGGTLLDRALRPLALVARPTDEEELGRLYAQLSHAGFRGERASFVYLGIKVLLALIFAALFLWINAASPQPLQYMAFFLIASMTVGFYLPNLWLSMRINDRQIKINRALPDTLDLLVTCVDAGLGLDAAMNRVAEEIALSAPLLSQEILQAALEIRAGATRGEAFRRLAFRTGVEEIRNLSSVIVQTEVFGTSMAKALRIMAEGMRVRRMQLAEERAATVAVKMTIPLVVCIMPALFTVLMGPAAVKIMRLLIPALRGGG